MIIFVTALPIEAKPFIVQYNLKQRTLHGFRFYENDNIRLIISGTGKIASAVAATIMLTQNLVHDESVLVQIGFAGTADREKKSGSLWLINSITDHSTNRAYYPDMIVKHPFRESGIRTVDSVLKSPYSDEYGSELIDMEASGFYQAGIRFVKAHQIIIFKIVSDHLDIENLSEEQLEKNMNAWRQSVCPYIELAHDELARDRNEEPPGQQDEIQTIRERLRLTETQFNQLRYAAQAYGIRRRRKFVFPETTSDTDNLTIEKRNWLFRKMIHELNQ